MGCCRDIYGKLGFNCGGAFVFQCFFDYTGQLWYSQDGDQCTPPGHVIPYRTFVPGQNWMPGPQTSYMVSCFRTGYGKLMISSPTGGAGMNNFDCFKDGIGQLWISQKGDPCR